MNPGVDLLPGDQFVENGQDLFAVHVGALDFGSHGQFIPVTPHQFVQKLLWDVDIPTQSFR